MRCIRFALLTAALLLSSSSTAGAATVQVEDRFPEQPEPTPQVVVEDTNAETNHISISYTYVPTHESLAPIGDAEVVVQDEAAQLQAGQGCQRHPDGSVRCQVDGLRAIDARLGGGADRGSVTPSSDVSCGCVLLQGGDGDDLLTSRDGASLHGGAGDDVLRGERSPAARVANPIARPDDDSAVGGPGDDVIETGRGRDFLQGGPGNDILHGGSGDDNLNGYVLASDTPGVPGDDQLIGGRGDDRLDDGDDNASPPVIGRDVLTGGRGSDTVSSYVDREERVEVNLWRSGGDGQEGEDDALINVERVAGGDAGDQLFGGSEDNRLSGGAGRNFIRGGRGADVIVADAPARHRVHGDRGHDVIETTPWARGPFRCGAGRDRLVQPRFGEGAERQPDRTRNLGPLVAGNCEAIGMLTRGGFALDPTPRLHGRRLVFRHTRGSRYLTVTWASKPFKRVDRARVRGRRTTVRLPRWLVRRAHSKRRGAHLRAELGGHGYRDTRMVWRFLVRP